MRHQYFQKSIEYLKGIGPQRAELLKKELNVFTVADLLTHYPFRYVDRSKFYKVNEIHPELPYVQLRGYIRNFNLVGEKRKQRLVAEFHDETGKLELVWFQGIKWVQDAVKTGVEHVVFCKPNSFNGKINLVHPEIEVVTEQNTTLAPSLQAVYPTTEKLKLRGVDTKGLLRIQKSVLTELPPSIPETLPDHILEEYHLMGLREALINIHFPKDPDKLQKARYRLKFEEFFFIQVKLLRMKVQRQQKFEGHRFESIGKNFNEFYNDKLPFPLTNAQKKVLKEIRLDVGSGRQMNRMVQGDVGSGKTLVALMSMLMAIDNGMQSCLMAPTEILANQHFISISEFLKGMDLKVALLTGSTKAKERRSIHEGLLSGEIDILIGTHALIEDQVQFKDLGFVVIDEQHRFGVEQRARLWKKNEKPPHVLVMTATPIPRTLAMTLYGDLDTSIIDELPPGRKPVQTQHRFDSHRLRVFGFMREQIELGRQIYVVYPLIKESEKADYKDLMDGFESISRAFPMPRYQVSIVHGKMKPADKDFEMNRFVTGQTQIMVATTVIEVGVNVPNASVMVIESAERFGLSQLHQLRGRVGRGADQSFCILMSSYKLSSEAKVRLETMVRTNDGFEISEMDLKLRGPGDLMGTQQSGLLDLKLADLAKDTQILQLARNAAQKLLSEDPNLSNSRNENILITLNTKSSNKTNWSRIS